jgi:UDP-glucose 4-epimerase
MDDKKTLLITGGSGFIGRNAVEYFSETGMTVLAPSHKDLDLLSDGEVECYLKRKDVDYVLHCANVGGNRKARDTGILEKNVRMFVNLKKHSRYFEKMIHLGSGAEYDKSRPLLKITENRFGDFIPTDEYGFSKYLISNLIQSSDNITCLRLFGIFGKYEDYEYKFISNAIVKNLLHLPINIRQNAEFDWLCIDDLMKIVHKVFDKDMHNKAYNVTSSKIIDLITIANIINSCSSDPVEISVDATGLNNQYCGDNKLLLKEIGNFNFTPVKQSISKLMNYYRYVLPSINKDTIEQDEYVKYCTVREDSVVD